MDLREYLFRKRMKITEFARKVDVSPSTILKAKEGRKVSLKLARKIFYATEGQVEFMSLIDVPEWDKKEGKPVDKSENSALDNRTLDTGVIYDELFEEEINLKRKELEELEEKIAQKKKEASLQEVS